MSDTAVEELLAWAIEMEETAVDLSGYGLTVLPERVGELTAVTQLSLRDNQLTSLPPSIGQLTQLTHLSVANNRLTSLPSSISRLTKLTHLNLKQNALSSLPVELLGLTQLQLLQLLENPLPIPVEVLQKWDRPEVILAYYRTHCLPVGGAEMGGEDVPWLLVSGLSEESFGELVEELILPPELFTAVQTRPEQARALFQFHEQHQLLPEFLALLRTYLTS